MATLQAARARRLGLSEAEAKSWGLNRALFYAAAKRAWAVAKARGSKRPIIEELETGKAHHDSTYSLGGERAFRERPFSGEQEVHFKFGNRIQTPADFDRQVKDRFGERWDEAWDEAKHIILESDPNDLDHQSRFFTKIYKPRRDELASKWSRVRQQRKVSKKAA